MRYWALVLTAASLWSGCTPENMKAHKEIYGELEADEVDVATRVAARVRRLAVSEGQQVKAGDVLVEFEDDVLSAKRRQVEAAIQAAQSQQSIAEHATRPEEQEQLRSALEAARKQLEFAKTSFERVKKLQADGAVSAQQFDEAKFKFESADEAFKAAQAKFNLGKQGARDENKAAAKAQVEAARSQLAEVQALQGDMSLTAPADAEVGKVLYREGELAPVGYPVVTLVKTQRPWATFHVTEGMLQRFPMGQKVSIEVPYVKRKLEGNVTYVSPLGTFATLVTTQDKSAFDLKTFEVHVALTGDLAGLRPGMTARVAP